MGSRRDAPLDATLGVSDMIIGKVTEGRAELDSATRDANAYCALDL